MKFEKLNENKIRITLSVQDLAEKQIDFHVFMSDPIESQSILIDMLDAAKKETGFDPEDYNLKVEALSMADTNFVFTITKVVPESKNKNPRKKFIVKRKSLIPPSAQAVVYSFNTFDDFCCFLTFLSDNKFQFSMKKIAKSITLYEYKEKYYLLMNNLNIEVMDSIKFYATITEFAKCVTNSKIFASKLQECGTLIMKNNALEIGFKHFVAK